MNHHKRGFTLTELLIVVIVIGILSAVVLPRYNKTLETRKTTEAEDILSAIRTEQERRCTLGKKYITDMAKLSEIVPNTETNNYTYSLFSTNAGGQGLSWHTVSASAISRGSYEYGLYMFSNSDGRICCQGPDCTKLNKDYPLCEELVTHTDLQRSAFEEARECGFETAAPIPNPSIPPSWEERINGEFVLDKDPGGSGGGGDDGPVCTPGETQEGDPCGCHDLYRTTRTCNAEGTAWTIDNSACSSSCECEGDQQESCGCDGHGTKTHKCNMSTYQWYTGDAAYTQCTLRDCECLGPRNEGGFTPMMGSNGCTIAPINADVGSIPFMGGVGDIYSAYGNMRCTDSRNVVCPSKMMQRVKLCGQDKFWTDIILACPCETTMATAARAMYDAYRKAGKTDKKAKEFLQLWFSAYKDVWLADTLVYLDYVNDPVIGQNCCSYAGAELGYPRLTNILPPEYGRCGN